MTPKEFKSWRNAMELKRGEAASLLGLKKCVVKKLEFEKNKKKRRGKKGKEEHKIPRYVELACYALSRGVSQFDGKTAKNSFNGLGAAEDIVMVKSKDKSAYFRLPG